MIRTLTPSLVNQSASTRPVGPAPTIKTWTSVVDLSARSVSAVMARCLRGCSFGLADFARGDTVFWAASDARDMPDPQRVVQDPTQLYTIAAAPYESLMLGIFTVHYGPHN